MEALVATKYHIEKIDGREIQKPLPKIFHSRAQAHILSALAAVVPADYEVLSELNVICGQDRLIPDIAVVGRCARYVDGDLADPAALCVEIMSPGQTLSTVFDRAERLLNAGVTAVWIIWPERRQAWAYTPQHLSESQEMLEARFDSGEIVIPTQEIWNSL
jgi:Uma2 family endonuclease